MTNNTESFISLERKIYISNMQHFLDETGSIPKQMPKEAREMASFLALVVDVTTKKIPSALTLTEIRCFEKRCVGTIKSELLRTTNEIHWLCSKCQNEGKISGWQGTRWDNNRGKRSTYKFKNSSKNKMTAVSY